MTPERHERIGQLYNAALELNPAERAAFLAEACGDDDLRREVETLVASHEDSGSFILQPPDDIAAGWRVAAAASPASSFAHYEMLSLLGRGGMGEVWLAQDTKLGRKVAVKLLPVDVTADPVRVRRFAQEARAASSLNHPNIITIYEIGEASTESGSRHYIATEYVEGETLRRLMTMAPGQQMPVNEVIDDATQIAAALTAAHEAGIVHRDIKPENVVVRRDRIVKVLDFGLAKLTEPRTPQINTQVPTLNGTEPGMLMGTPRYMSPEQARGEIVDARTDIFSVGVLIYEMVTGRAPFAGTTMNETIAAVLRDEPAAFSESVPDAPPELERIVSRALCKDRALRYQTAQQLLTDLKQLKQHIEFGTRPIISRRSTRKVAASAVAILLVLVALVGWFYFNRLPALTEKDTILLADFENKTGDDIFDGALKQALAIQLQQSPFLNLFPESRVRQTLGLMGRPPNDRVTAEVAGDICVRNNLKALIAGAIAPLGTHYVITLEAINGHSGESLARQQVEAGSREQVLKALSEAASQLREKLGESLSSIQRFDTPVSLVEATTSKLEAFKAWSLGVENSAGGRAMEAIPFYKRAIDLDPDFAHAYSVLSTIYGYSGRPELAAEYAAKGYRLRDRVSEYEKLRITNFYYGFATGDLSARIDVLKLLNSTYLRDGAAASDLALTYSQIGQFDQAVAEARESIQRNPHFAPSHRALVLALFRLNRFGDAKDTIAQALQQKLDHTDFHSVLYQVAFCGGDSAAMQEQLDWLLGKPNEYLASNWQSGAAAFAGQWRKSQESARRAIDLADRGDTREIAALYTTEQSLYGAVFGDCRRAKEDAAQGLKLTRGRSSLPRAALALALCGEPDQAKLLADESLKLYPEDTVINSIWTPAIRAAIDLQRGNGAQAVDVLLPASHYEAAAEFWPQYLRGVSYLRLKRGAEAAAEFQKILDNRGQASLSPLYPLAYLGLARAWDLVGDTSKSLRSRSAFFDAWKDADPDLPVLVEARREYGGR
jgi:serine/threonine protein kinase/Flp pilus assembly protein TadD